MDNMRELGLKIENWHRDKATRIIEHGVIKNENEYASAIREVSRLIDCSSRLDDLADIVMDYEEKLNTK